MGILLLNHTKWSQGFQGYSRLSYEDSQTLPFQILFKTIGFPKVCADWCEKNCIGGWGWYFMSNGIAVDDVYVGFEHQNEMFMFQIYWAEQFERRRVE